MQEYDCANNVFFEERSPPNMCDIEIKWNLVPGWIDVVGDNNENVYKPKQ